MLNLMKLLRPVRELGPSHRNAGSNAGFRIRDNRQPADQGASVSSGRNGPSWAGVRGGRPSRLPVGFSAFRPADYELKRISDQRLYGTGQLGNERCLTWEVLRQGEWGSACPTPDIGRFARVASAPMTLEVQPSGMPPRTFQCLECERPDPMKSPVIAEILKALQPSK
jgi:hypothetical protein